MLRIFPYRAQKTSVTAGTLCAIRLDILVKMIQNNIMERIKAIDAEIYEFITHYKDLLLKYCSNNIIGIYLFGSLAYGGFDKDRSDIDIAVITKELIKKLNIDTIKNIHKEMENINPKWSKRFEASYTSVEMLKENEPPKEPRPYYGKILHEEAKCEYEWLINNYLLYNYGITIYGPEFKVLMKEPIKIKDVQEACRKDFYERWLPSINEHELFSNPEYSIYQSFVVLNTCRIIYTLYKSELTNKQKACEWVEENYNEWTILINEALNWRHGEVINKESEIKEFIGFAKKIIENETIEK